MPFRSLTDPVDIARAQAALDTIWSDIRSEIANADQERERMRLAYIIVSFVHVALDEADLVRRARERYRKNGS